MPTLDENDPHSMNLLARIVLFVSSYAPLGGLYFLLYICRDNRIAFVSLAIAMISIFSTWLLLLWWKRDVEATCDTVLEFRKPGAEVMGYIASYLLPFLGFSLESVRNLAILGVYLFVVGYLYVTTDMVRVNPTLSLFLRYGIYEVTLSEHGATWLIAQGRIRQGRRIPVVSAGPGFVIQKEDTCVSQTSR